MGHLSHMPYLPPPSLGSYLTLYRNYSPGLSLHHATLYSHHLFHQLEKFAFSRPHHFTTDYPYPPTGPPAQPCSPARLYIPFYHLQALVPACCELSVSFTVSSDILNIFTITTGSQSPAFTYCTDPQLIHLGIRDEKQSLDNRVDS